MSAPTQLVGQTEVPMYPKAGAANAIMSQPKPCITILVHGVNDLGGVYAAIEKGLCQGLNERLDHLTTTVGGINKAALIPAAYSLPTEHDHSATDPDAVYYRRQPGVPADPNVCSIPRSVVIPFYWGFREQEGVWPDGKQKKQPYIKKDAPHGEWLDRYGNRLDKAGTKEGGAFANATTTLPDMWGDGFNGMLFGIIPIDAIGGSPTHPLLDGPNRTYMVLAAKRLAMLVTLIRNPTSLPGTHGVLKEDCLHDTINVVAHSQGTMITLLANAMLKHNNQRPIDSAVLMNPPYSLIEPVQERMFQLHGKQQTAPARLETLQRIVQFIGEQPQTSPKLADVADARKGIDQCIGGLRWHGYAATTTLGGNDVTFTDRDNRGNVYLYFTPQDHTVGLRNIQGIGWQGVPGDQSLGVLASLGPHFYQRVFTTRTRDDSSTLKSAVVEEVGTKEHEYILLQGSEETWGGDGEGIMGDIKRHHLDKGQKVSINAPQLPVPCVTRFDNTELGDKVFSTNAAGIQQVRTHMDVIDAAIAVSHGGWKPNDYSQTPGGGYIVSSTDGYIDGQTKEQLQAVLNKGKTLSDQTTVDSVTPLGNGQASIVRSETPNEAKQRLMKADLTAGDNLSFHSAIPANAEHSRCVVAYDVAVGQAKSIDDEGYYAYLCRVADWRLDWTRVEKGNMANADVQASVSEDMPNATTLDFYKAESLTNKKLIDDTAKYKGKNSAAGILDFIDDTVGTLHGSGVVSYTRDQRRAGPTSSTGNR